MRISMLSFKTPLMVMLAHGVFNASLLLAQAPASSGGNPPSYFDERDLDRQVSPCDDFYQFACGGWEARTSIPPDRSGWSRGFYEVDQRNEQVLRTALENFAKETAKAANDEQRKLGDYYATCMDESKRETASMETLRRRLATLDAVRDQKQLAVQVARLHLEGADALFSFGSSQDYKDSSQMIAEADQGGLGLPDREYYLSKKGKMPEIRRMYQEHIKNMLVLLGQSPTAAAKDAAVIMKIETSLAKAAMDRVERRDPLKVYHRLDRRGLMKLAPHFAWDSYFEALGYPGLQAMNVTHPPFFKELNRLVKGTALADLRTYLRWHSVTEAASALSKAFENEDFRFTSKALTGQTELPPRWRRCVAASLEAMSEPLGRVFIEKTFGGNSKEEAQAMIHAIEAKMSEDLKKIDWMDEPTRAQALAKLAKVNNQIGYPDKWRDYSGLAVDRQSFLGNLWAAAVFNSQYYLNKIGKPVDRSEWHMPPSMVNAYYSPDNNKMVFPAGILQAPFFNKAFPPYVNYGGIGMVMGHELTHGFDDQGRKFDAVGNMREWWTDKVAKEFDQRASCLVKQYNEYVAIDDLHVNGELTLGENIADQGGIKLAYGAWLASHGDKGDSVAGFNPKQQFFLAFAQSWCSKLRPELQRTRVTTDPHSPARFRVNGPLSNFQEFGEAFSCKAGSKMTPAKRCSVW